MHLNIFQWVSHFEYHDICITYLSRASLSLMLSLIALWYTLELSLSRARSLYLSRYLLSLVLAGVCSLSALCFASSLYLSSISLDSLAISLLSLSLSLSLLSIAMLFLSLSLSSALSLSRRSLSHPAMLSLIVTCSCEWEGVLPLGGTQSPVLLFLPLIFSSYGVKYNI